MVRRLFQSRFIEVEEAENGQEAIDKYQSSLASGKPIHVIMMDNSMPVMNGKEATKRIKDFIVTNNDNNNNGNSRVVIIGVTGNGLERDVSNFIQSGVDKVMIKPLDVDNFMKYLAEFHIMV
jgi:CheY-like chemotaxis protein